MRNKLANFFTVLGIVLILAALALLGYNAMEDAQAQNAAAQVVEQLQEQLETPSQPTIANETLPQEILPTLPDTRMKEALIDGQLYIGRITVPALSLELPVLSEWDYDKLRIAPCRYYGSTGGNDLVIMAHNYRSHFGDLDTLKEGDTVYFTDVDGKVFSYTVVARDVLDPYGVEQMIAGDFDLTLFTCTYGGQTRVCVYCNRS